jgi:hypothetical protein
MVRASFRHRPAEGNYIEADLDHAQKVATGSTPSATIRAPTLFANGA